MNPKTLWIAALLAFPMGASAVDWSKVPEKEIVLFQPGQASWEWALTERDHSGAPKFREGKNCKGCHEGEQEDIGAKIAKGGQLEPAPIAGRAGSLKLRVQAARDAHAGRRRGQGSGACRLLGKLP
ncbi:MAG: hypothetical protein ACT4UP_06930 [Gammaproteobacteria bacterium]